MKNNSGIYPFDLRVLVKPEQVDEKYSDLIIKPDAVKEREQFASMKGVLIEVGGSAFGDWADPIPKPGDTVLFKRYGGDSLEGKDGDQYRLVNDEDILALFD